MKNLVWCAIPFAAATLSLAQAPPSAAPQGSTESPARCAASVAFSFQDSRGGEFRRQVSVWKVPEGSAFYFDAGMTIDADGAPNAYNPQNTGLDDLKNAGGPGRWEGLAQDQNGDPYIQGPNDPFPGYYVSCTSLTDDDKPDSDPTKYIDATKIPYIVLPRGVIRQTGAHIGDFAVVTNLRNGRSSYAIFADVGTMGEGSIALAKRLDIDPDAREGGTRGPVRYLVFPGSGNSKPRALSEIESISATLYQNWGGPNRIITCPTN